MIIKCLSAKSDKAVENLIKYVLTDDKLEPLSREQRQQRLYVPGVKLSKQDRKYLEMERSDAALMKEFKERCRDGNMKEFIEKYLLNTKVKPEDIAKEAEKTKLNPVIIKNNVRSRTVKGYIKEFRDNEKQRLHMRDNSVIAFHHILSFSQKDGKNLNEKILKDIAEHFISLKGDKSLFVGAVHQDRDHLHVHLVQSGVKYITGESNRISQREFHELKVAMQEYQMTKYPQLVHSLPDHEKSANDKTKGAPPKNIKTPERLYDKEILLGLLETTYAKSTSVEHFLSEIKSSGHEVYFRDGRIQGIRYEGPDGRKFRFKNLGYDEQKLKALDAQKDKVEKTLNELKEIRAGRNKEATRNISDSVNDIETKNVTINGEEKALREIADIRSGKNDRGTERDKEPDFGRDISDDGSDSDADDTVADDTDDRDSESNESDQETDNEQDDLLADDSDDRDDDIK